MIIPARQKAWAIDGIGSIDGGGEPMDVFDYEQVARERKAASLAVQRAMYPDPADESDDETADDDDG